MNPQYFHLNYKTIFKRLACANVIFTWSSVNVNKSKNGQNNVLLCWARVLEILIFIYYFIQSMY